MNSSVINLIVSEKTEYNLNVPLEEWSNVLCYICVVALYIVIKNGDTKVFLFTRKAVTNVLLIEESILQRAWTFFFYFG